MRVGKAASLARQSIEMRRLDLRRAITTDITVTDIVGQDHNHVGAIGRLLFCRQSLARERREERHAQEMSNAHRPPRGKKGSYAPGNTGGSLANVELQ